MDDVLIVIIIVVGIISCAIGKAIKIQWSHSYSLDDGQNVWVVYKVLTETLYCINEDRVGCGACEGVCPTGAIKLNEDGKAEVDEDTCIDCQACVGACPVGAISE